MQLETTLGADGATVGGKRDPLVGQGLLTRLTVPMVEAFRSSGHWGSQTIYDCAYSHALHMPESPAVRERGAAISYGDLIAAADGMAAELERVGLRPGDRIAVWMPSRIEVAILLLAASRNGYVICPSLHKNHTVSEIGELVARMKARAVFVERDYGADAVGKDLEAEFAGLDHISLLSVLEPATGPRSWSHGDGVAGGPGGDADDIVYLAFTSGTTAAPKGVMHSNNTLLANARSFAADWQIKPGSVVYTLSPLSHNLGFGAMVMCMMSGAEIVVHDLPRGASLLDRLKDTETSFIFGVPAHGMDLLAEIETRKVAPPAKLTGFRISGAAAPATLVSKLIEHGITPQSGYGMTEAGSHHYTRMDDDADRVVRSSGKACDGYDVAIFSVDDPDKPVEPGTVGQIGGRGASLMLGYFDNQAATEAAFNRTGWFMTGDLGVLDADGYLQITGRIKEIIIRGGHNIHPNKIEHLATSYPAVERAAAVPVKDERLGEKVCLAVTVIPGGEVEAQALLEHLANGGLSKFDMPEYFLVLDELPHSANGKPLKRALTAAIEQGTYVPSPIRYRAK
ncbi:class I adenylate-forming enzyme family protein [Phaeobacter sp. PT47_59]|uniref:class I adenylate-forming enzyme family protein n=1 Tax=Phaeobacter sp. PT47_59 TaxID=3029979 RepID=UPI0023803588|nr:class I adenylate-forming enzyme family protein [Phaeobacter sp. PT47_59]MDE4175409.1 class I adenylate-forming enzyme family protein [Phaeobacter sp. PT47_59]